MKLVEYADQEMMMIDLANQLAGALANALMTSDSVSFAVPGGTTPGPVFDALCASNIDWERVTVLPTDDRWVPETDPASNAALIREHLLTSRAAAATFLPFYAQGATPDAAVGPLAEALEPLLPLSVALLGMGADMHTASLFPGAERLASALHEDAPPVMAMRAPVAPEERVTLTAPALNEALSIHVVITGAEKRAALERAEAIGDPMRAPICTVLRDATVHWAE